LLWSERITEPRGAAKPQARVDLSPTEDYDRWLGPTSSIEDLKAMLKPYDPALMEAYAVNRAVNSVKNDTEECIEPVAD
jgi:putative SOS response-associated peptidase YedK